MGCTFLVSRKPYINPHHRGSTPTRSTRPSRFGNPVASTSKNQRTPLPVHRPHSPKDPPSSVFTTIDLDEADSNSPVVPRHVRKRVPKIVESAFGRNEQFSPVRSSQTRADSSPGFDLLVERRAALKAGTSRQAETRSTGDNMNWEELQELPPNTPEPGPSSPSTSKRGSVEPRGSSPLGLNNDLPRPGPQPSNAIDTERKMIEAREALSSVTLRFRARLPRPTLSSKSPDMTNGGGGETHPFDESTHPFDETTHPFDETASQFDDSQAQGQEPHPFDEDSRIPSQETHPFDEETQRPLDSIVDSQTPGVGRSSIRMGISPVPPAPGGSKPRMGAFLSTSLLESRYGRNSRSPSNPPPVSPIDRLRPGLLHSPNHPSCSSRSPATYEPAATNNPLRRLEVPTPIGTPRSPLRSPRSSMEDRASPSPQKARTKGASHEDGRPNPTVTQQLREVLESSPRTRRASADVEIQPKTHGEARSTLSGILLTLLRQ